MRYCACGKGIPSDAKIDGETHNLRNRTQCLSCLPLGSSPYSARYPESEQSELRKAANRVKQRKHTKKFAEEHGDYRANMVRRGRKAAFLRLLGGACLHCGYDKLARNLVFHHTGSKEFELTERAFQFGFKKILPEAKKCILLCHNCHGEIHDGLFDGVIERERMDVMMLSIDEISLNTEWQRMQKALLSKTP